MFKKYISSAAFVSLIAFSTAAFGYETTTFSVSLGDPQQNGSMSLGNAVLGNATGSITQGGNVYTSSYQYFTPTTSGTYVFGQLTAPVDSVILLYSPTYSTAQPDQNFIEMNDDGDSSSIADAALKAYVDAAIAARSCGGSDSLCPLLVSNLLAGIDYYIVVSTYRPGFSLGGPTDELEFFVIGDALVGVGGQPPAGGYPGTAPKSVSSLAGYLDENDNSGDLAIVGTYLDTASEEQVEEALKEIFPVNTAVTTQVMGAASGQTATVLIDKVGTVLGNISTPSSASFAGGSFNTADWMFGSSTGEREDEYSRAFSQMDVDGGSGDMVASLASLPYKKFGTDERAFWIQGVGSLTNGDETDTAHGFDVTNAGIVSGFEMTLNGDNLVGIIASVFQSDVDLDSDAGTVDASTYSLGLYGQHLIGSMKLTGIFLGSYSDYNSERFVDVGGITGRPEADYDGWGTSTTLALSKLYEHNDVKIEPFISANYSTASTDGYGEEGGGVFNMEVESDDSSTASVKTGVTFQHQAELGQMPIDLKLKPYVGYQWEINEASNAVRLSGAASSVVVSGQDADTLQGGLSMEASLKLNETGSFKIGMDVSGDKNQESGLVYVGYGLKF